MTDQQLLKINLGCGDGAIPGFVNVDALPEAKGVDVVADLSQPLPFPDGSASLIYASHILEHFATDEVPDLLRDWRRVLADGGEICVAVPDLEAIARIIIERGGWFTPPHAPWVAVIYGGQKDSYDFHKTGFTGIWLAHLLGDAGFEDCRVVDRFEDIGKADASFSAMPFGTNISLNMRARAGRAQSPPENLSPGFARFFGVVDGTLCWLLSASTAVRSRLMMRRRIQMERRIRS